MYFRKFIWKTFPLHLGIFTEHLALAELIRWYLVPFPDIQFLASWYMATNKHMHPEVIHLATLRLSQFFVYVLTVFQYIHSTYHFKSSAHMQKGESACVCVCVIYGHIYVLWNGYVNIYFDLVAHLSTWACSALIFGFAFYCSTDGQGLKE